MEPIVEAPTKPKKISIGTAFPEQISDPSKIKIPGQEYLCYEIELTSISPGILMNRLDEGVLAFPDAKSTKRPPKGDVSKTKLPSNIISGTEDVARVDLAAAYRSAHGVAYFIPGVKKGAKKVLCCPADNLQAMALDAGRSWPNTGLLRTVGASVFIDESYIPFLHIEKDEPLALPDGDSVEFVYHTRMKEPSTEPCILIKAAKSSRGKRILTARVFLPQWRLVFRVFYDAVMISKKAAEEVILQSVWTYAGGYVGQMSWRPGSEKSPGPHGRFRVTRHEQIKI